MSQLTIDRLIADAEYDACVTAEHADPDNRALSDATENAFFNRLAAMVAEERNACMESE